MKDSEKVTLLMITCVLAAFVLGIIACAVVTMTVHP